VLGLAGRLRIELESLDHGLRHAVYLELKNISLNPIAVTNQPDTHAELSDPAGKPIRTMDYLTSGPSHAPQWAVIPPDVYVGFRIDMQTVGIPTSAHRTALLAVGDKGWALKAGTYVLTTTVVFERQREGPTNQWVGQLQLPPSEFRVTEEMLASAD